MQKLSLISVILCFGFFVGCGDDDSTGPEPPSIVTVTAATGTVAPARLSVDDSVWTRISPKTIAVASNQLSSAGKNRPAGALAVAPNVAVQAVVVHDTLWIRMAWDDATWDRWPDRYSVTTLQVLGTDTLANFTQDMLSAREDQAMLLFQVAGETDWDVWHWRTTTTGAGLLAEGKTLEGTVLTPDGGTSLVITSNEGFGGQPANMHPEGPTNQDHILSEYDAVALDPYLRWAVGDLIPGWLIDDSLYLPQNAAARAGRFDIGACSDYSSGGYVVVMHRAMNSGDGADIDMTAVSSLNMRIGVADNSDFLLNQGGTRQGFTATFRLSLP